MPSAGARLESIPEDAHFIAFPVTDGDSSRWPQNTHPPAMSAREVNWLRKMTMEEKYVCRWRNLIGQGLAKLLDKPDKEKYCLQSFPEGYWMFDHNKGPVSNIRHDLYLHGSKTALRFRSPAEFIPHGYWLLTDPTLNNQNCGCKYCGGGGKKTQTEISESLGLPTNRGPTSVTGIRNGGTRPNLRVPGRSSNTTASAGPWVPKEKRALRKMDPAWRTTSLGLGLVANSPRISDLRSGRMFRLGELVWCQWDVEILPTAKGKEIDQRLRLWPAIIIDYGLEISRDSTSPLGFTDFGSIVQKQQYVLRRLGTRSLDSNTDYECTLSEDNILPWHAHRTDLTSLSLPTPNARPDHHHDSLDFALRTADKLIRFWAVCDRLPIKVPLPPATAPAQENQSSTFLTPVKQTPFSESTKNPSTSSRSTPAISTPYLMATTPPQRSPVRLVPASVTKAPRPRIRSPEVERLEPPNPTTNTAPSQRIRELRDPQVKVVTVTETRYQGLWYGAERIWTGDLVRLSPERQAFSESLKLSLKVHGGEKWQRRITPAPGSNTRGVLMRIDKIFVRSGEGGTKECAVSGPLYEIAPEDWTDPHASDSLGIIESSWQSSFPTSKGSSEPTHPWDMADKPPPRGDKVQSRREFLLDIPSLPSPATCSGYTLRPLLPLGFEIPVPVSYIAGRYYPDILKSPLLANILRNIPKNVRSLGDFASSDWHAVELMSLCALAPGRYNYAVCVDVKLASRTGMLQDAIRLASAELGHVKTDSLVQEHVMDLG